MNRHASSQLTDREGELLRKCLADEGQREHIRRLLPFMEEELAALRQALTDLRETTWAIEGVKPKELARPRYSNLLALEDALSVTGLGVQAEELCRNVENVIERYKMVLDMAGSMSVVTRAEDAT